MLLSLPELPLLSSGDVVVVVVIVVAPANEFVVEACEQDDVIEEVDEVEEAEDRWLLLLFVPAIDEATEDVDEAEELEVRKSKHCDMQEAI